MFSIIIPIRNAERYLKECLDSCVSQDYQHFEIIVVDNASTDGGPGMVETYRQKYPFIQYIRHDSDRGLLQSRITGAKAASGEYIINVDADDYFATPKALSIIAKAAKKTGADIIQYGVKTNGAWGFWFEVNRDFFGSQEDILKNIDYIFSKSHTIWCRSYKTSLYLKSISSIPEDLYIIIAEDLVQVSLLLEHCGSYAYIPDSLYFYRIHTNNYNQEMIGQLTPEGALQYLNNISNAAPLLRDACHPKIFNHFSAIVMSGVQHRLAFFPFSLLDKADPQWKTKLQQTFGERRTGKMLSPKISIVVPVYNTEEFLPYCLDSLLGQTFKEIEIIVVNDNSPGNCRNIIIPYLAKNPHLVFVDLEENKGTLGARLAGFRAAKGEYVQSVDSDDTLVPDACEIIYNKLIQSGADICHITANLYPHPDVNAPFPLEGVDAEMFAPRKAVYSHTEWIRALTQNKVDNCIWSYIIRKSLIIAMADLIPVDQKIVLYEDLLQIFTLATLRVNKVVCLPQKLYQYRIGVGIMSLTFSLPHYLRNINNTLFVMQFTQNLLKESPFFNKQAQENFASYCDTIYAKKVAVYKTLASQDQLLVLDYLEECGELKKWAYLLGAHTNHSSARSYRSYKIPAVNIEHLVKKLLPPHSLRRKLAKKIYTILKKIYKTIRGK